MRATRFKICFTKHAKASPHDVACLGCMLIAGAVELGELRCANAQTSQNIPAGWLVGVQYNV